LHSALKDFYLGRATASTLTPVELPPVISGRRANRNRRISPDGLPLDADAPLLSALYHGLVMHSASVPDALAWQACNVLKEQPL
jgi:hypothetical protein